MVSTMQRTGGKVKSVTATWPLSKYKTDWLNKYKDKDIGAILHKEAIPSLAKVCEIRDCEAISPQTALQAAMYLLNKTVPDRVETVQLTASVDLNKLLEVYLDLHKSASINNNCNDNDMLDDNNTI